MQGVAENQANNALVKDVLDAMIHDSENLERTMSWMSDDCVWVMEPGGTEYHGKDQIRGFVDIAMSSRTHDTGQHKVEIVNWFAAGDNLCVEYTHGLVSTGAMIGGIKAKVRAGVLRYCITYHLHEGKIDRVHEYINSTSWWLQSFLPIGLGYLRRLTTGKLADASGSQHRSFGLLLAAGLMVLFGLAEVVTGFTHSFMGITTSGAILFTLSSVMIGSFYVFAGLLLLTMKKWAASLAIVLLVLDILGRIALVLTGLYPTDTPKNTFAIITGTLIAALFAVYTGWKRRSFR